MTESELKAKAENRIKKLVARGTRIQSRVVLEIEKRLKIQLFVSADPTIALKFLNFYFLQFRYGASISEIVDILFERYGFIAVKSKNGIPLRTVSSDAAIEHVQNVLLERYPNFEQRSTRASRQRANWFPSALPKDVPLNEYTKRYVQKLKARRKAYKHLKKEALLRPYRGCPWI